MDKIKQFFKDLINKIKGLFDRKSKEEKGSTPEAIASREIKDTSQRTVLSPQISSFPHADYYATKRELVKFIEMDTASRTKLAKVIYSIPLQKVNKGSLIRVRAICEMSNKNEYPAFMVTGVVMADSSHAVGGEIIGAFNGSNVYNTKHHHVAVQHGHLVAYKDLEGKYINLVAFAARSGIPPRYYVSVEAGYGSMEVEVHKHA